MIAANTAPTSAMMAAVVVYSFFFSKGMPGRFGDAELKAAYRGGSIGGVSGPVKDKLAIAQNLRAKRPAFRFSFLASMLRCKCQAEDLLRKEPGSSVKI